MARVFILEDDPERLKTFRQVLIGHELTVAESVLDGVVKWNPYPMYDYLFLDHDLGGQQMVESTNINTGYEFIQRIHRDLTWGKPYKPRIMIHSLNPVGADNMCKYLKDLGASSYQVMQVPFPKLITAIKETPGLK